MTDASDTPHDAPPVPLAPGYAPLAPGYAPFPPGAPGAGQSFHGWGAAPSPLPLEGAGRSKQAIAAFALGLLGVIPLGVLFGVLALVRIPRTRKKGKVLAILGLVFSGLWIVGGVLTLLVASLFFASAGNSSALPLLSGHPGQQAAARIPIGSCFNLPGGKGPVDWVTVVPCTTPHDRQMYARVPVQGPFPGQAQNRYQAMIACARAEYTYFVDPWGLARQDAVRHSYYPVQAGWGSATAQDWCTVGARKGDPPLSVSVDQSPSRYTSQQRSVLDALRETGMLRAELGDTLPSDWSEGRQVAAELVAADRAEAHALPRLSALSTAFQREAGVTLAQQDVQDAAEASALAHATNEAQWSADMDAVYAHDTLGAAFNTIWINLGLPANG